MAKQGYCAKCGKYRELKRNHLDGNHDNNSVSNVEYWCDECHAKYHQYKKGENSGTHLGER